MTTLSQNNLPPDPWKLFIIVEALALLITILLAVFI